MLKTEKDHDVVPWNYYNVSQKRTKPWLAKVERVKVIVF